MCALIDIGMHVELNTSLLFMGILIMNHGHANENLIKSLQQEYTTLLLAWKT